MNKYEKSWLGEGEKEILPMGCKTKHYGDVVGEGGISNYPDTYEKASVIQEKQIKEIRKQKVHR